MRLLLYILACKAVVIVGGAVLAMYVMVGVRVLVDLANIALAVVSAALRMI